MWNWGLDFHPWVQAWGWASSCPRARSRSARSGCPLRPWRLKRRWMCTSMFFSTAPEPLWTGAGVRPRPRRRAAGRWFCSVAAAQASCWRAGGEQPGGFGTQEDFREGEVAAGGFVAHHARGQSDGAEGGEPVEGAPALGAEAVGVLGQPSLLEGGEGLEVEWASGGAGGTGPSTGQMSPGEEPIRSLVESEDGPVAPGAEYRS